MASVFEGVEVEVEVTGVRSMGGALGNSGECTPGVVTNVDRAHSRADWAL